MPELPGTNARRLRQQQHSPRHTAVATLLNELPKYSEIEPLNSFLSAVEATPREKEEALKEWVSTAIRAAEPQARALKAAAEDFLRARAAKPQARALRTAAHAAKPQARALKTAARALKDDKAGSLAAAVTAARRAARRAQIASYALTFPRAAVDILPFVGLLDAVSAFVSKRSKASALDAARKAVSAAEAVVR